jgi:hypothetical protein
MAYKLSDRAKEWTSYAGLAVAAIGACLPQVVPLSHFVQYFGDAQIALGAVMVALPQNAGTTAVENDALTLLQALSAKIPPAYSAAMQPFIAMLAKGILMPQAAAAPVPQLPQPVVAQPVVTQPTAPAAPAAPAA